MTITKASDTPSKGNIKLGVGVEIRDYFKHDGQLYYVVSAEDDGLNIENCATLEVKWLHIDFFERNLLDIEIVHQEKT